MPSRTVWIVLSAVFVSLPIANAGGPSKAEVRANLAGLEVTRAVQSGDAALVAKLIRNKRVNLDASEGNLPAPLCAAIQTGRPDLVRMLLGAGASATRNNCLGFSTPLISAIIAHNVEIVDLLLAAKANPNYLLGTQISPLYKAIEQDQPEIFERLLAVGAIVKDLMASPNPLTYAAKQGRVFYLKRLLEAGAHNDNFDLLQDLARSGSTEVLRVLLDGGASANMTNYKHESLLNTAIQAGQVEAARMLLGAGAKVEPSSAILALVKSGNAELLPVLLQAGASANTHDENGDTLLMLAAGNGSVNMVKALLVAGADVNARSPAGASALLWSASQSNVEVMRLLLAAKADAKVRSANGSTALIVASTVRGVDNAAVLALAKTLPVIPPMQPKRKDTVYASTTGHVKAEAFFKGRCRIVDGREKCRVSFETGEMLIRTNSLPVVLKPHADYAELLELLQLIKVPYTRVGFDAVDVGGAVLYVVDGAVEEIAM